MNLTLGTEVRSNQLFTEKGCNHSM